jgi:cytochrome c peroxidase
MKTIVAVVIITFTTIVLFTAHSCSAVNQQDAGQQFKTYYEEKTGLLIKKLDTLSMDAQAGKPLPLLQQRFANTRYIYKETELITEYYFQGLTRRINGPALPDVKTEDGVVWAPHGFQVIEQLLYDAFSPSKNKQLTEEIRQLQTDLRFTIANLKEMTVSQKHIKEMLQHQLVRIASMGISGFDAPLSKLSLPETAYSLRGVKQIAAITENNAVAQQTERAIGYLNKNADFDSFNRLEFITEVLAPLANLVEKDVVAADAPAGELQPFKGGLGALMSGKGFNPDYYVNYEAGKTNADKIALGKSLFYDTQLSRSQTISCASCHQPALFFTDGSKTANNLVHGGSLQRNTPTLLYAALQAGQFYDLRSASLEDQINEVMNNGNEFNLAANNAVKKIMASKTYPSLFSKAFGEKDTVSSYTIRNAIAAYIRSLMPFSSDFDAYLKGSQNKLTAQQQHGFNLFMGKAKCGTCHFFPLFNGTVPPWYQKSESEIIGVPQAARWLNAVVDSDPGRFKINPFPELQYAFKTPTVRNAAQTAPYMHNGVYTTLDEVVLFYSKGGGVGLGMELPFQTLPFDSLQLNDTEKKAIVSFMQALTDEKPVQ